MKMSQTLIASLMMVTVAAVAHAKPPQQGEPSAEPMWPSQVSDNSAYLAELRLVRQELTRFEKDRRWRDSLVQLLATEYSFVGRNQKALELFDEVLGNPSKNRQAMTLDGYEACDAVETIAGLADRHQVIMVNEAHHVPMHRAFTIQLLESLYSKGFRYFAVETLTAADESLQSRGYPTRKSGFYVPEPICADMVRIAIQLGYQVVPYEFEEQRPPQPGDDILTARRAREDGQAKNLKERILSKDPKAKILVHAGHSHISKKVMKGNLGELRFMALAFQTLTEIEPLCIDQTMMTEHGKRDRESPEYRYAVEHKLVTDKSVVLRQQSTQAWFVPAPAEEIQCDLVVFHPRSRYEGGRPTWLAMGGRRKPHLVRSEARPPQGTSYVVQALYEQETEADAVPVDQMEYGPEDPIPTLWVPAGAFRIRVLNERGTTVHEYSLTENQALPVERKGPSKDIQSGVKP